MIIYQIEVEYLGKKFVGWQSQKNGISIQETIERIFSKILKFLSDAMTPINKPEMIITGSVIIAINPPNRVPTKPELVAIPSTKIKIFAIKIALVADTTYDMPRVKDMRAIALD